MRCMSPATCSLSTGLSKDRAACQSFSDARTAPQNFSSLFVMDTPHIGKSLILSHRDRISIPLFLPICFTAYSSILSPGFLPTMTSMPSSLPFRKRRRILCDDGPGIVVKGDHMLCFQEFRGEERILRPHRVVIPDRKDGIVDIIHLAEELSSPKSAVSPA